MSRSSKGYADFFPTAPSVLQQKRFKAAQSRKKPKSSPVIEKSANAPSEPPPSPHSEPKGATVSADGRHDQVLSNSAPTAQEESESVSECVNGDLLNGVGSASSTSTASSVFSNGHHTLSMAHLNETTPLTNVDSSPPSNARESPHQQNSSNVFISTSRDIHRIPSPNQTTAEPLPIAPSIMESTSTLQVRPGPGEVKGVKLIYDPYRNKKLTAEERRSAEVQYMEFGKDVRTLNWKEHFLFWINWLM